MNPQDVFCPNFDCPARGQRNKGNIHIHSQKGKRCVCTVCGQTFCLTKGSIFYRLHYDSVTVMLVLALLAYGCPVKAIVNAFRLDERTVKKWWQRAQKQAQQVHEHMVGSSPQDLKQVQGDEIRVKTQRGVYWMAMAIAVPTRLWLGGVISPRRDLDLIRALAEQVRKVALCRPLLLAVDGLSSYVTAFRQAFRSPLPSRGKGRPRLIPWSNIAIVQVVKQRRDHQLTIERRIVQGSLQLVEHLIKASQGSGGINTAYIERLNATFRQRLSCLARRTRHLARHSDTLLAGMYVVGCIYNFCDEHQSLRLRLSVGRYGYRWVQRTPAMAAGLTDHCWTIQELFTFKIPPPLWSPPPQRGRRSKTMQAIINQWCGDHS